MPITLVTGTPGSGKSLYAVWLLKKEVKAGRRLLVNGIKGLALDHELLSDDDVRRWHEIAQPQDILLVDEVQRIWPPVPMGSKPTTDIEKLHVHRHMGVDVMVITQHPNRMNKTVRDLVGRHVHVRRLLGMQRAILYEWDSVRNPGAGFRDAVKTFWKYPRDVFKLYVSAEVHTKPKAVVPKAVFIIPLALIVAGVLVWRGYHGVSGFGSFGKSGSPGAAAASGAVAASVADAKAPASALWRVAGQYSVDGRGYVLLADAKGRFRSELSDGFKGDTLRVAGVVDGERVAVWTGAIADGEPAKGTTK